jgi:hypothetical protein
VVRRGYMVDFKHTSAGGILRMKSSGRQSVFGASPYASFTLRKLGMFIWEANADR